MSTRLLKSQYDHRQYRHLTLENGARVVLVSDNNAKKSAAAVTIKCGHFNDPIQQQGLAHLLEHMLFLGCQRFNEINHLQTFLSQYGGNCNAWTGTEHSSFYFDVLNAQFPQALDHFLAMLREPLFDIERLESEIHTIDAEFKMKRNDDLRRLYQVHKETCNPLHPFSKFSVGNAQSLMTLSVQDTQAALIEMHTQHYCASNMTFSLIGNEPLDTLETLASCLLQPITKAPAQAISFPPLYLPEQVGISIQIQPVKKARRLIVTFALPDMHPYHRSKPLEMISHLLGDESKGGLLWYLKEKDWATSLSAGGGIHGSNFKDFNINLQLTSSGVKHYQQVISALFLFIQLMREQGCLQWRFQEKQRLNQLAFDFQEFPKNIDYAQHIAAQLQYYNEHDVLSGEYLVDHYSPEDFADVLTFLRPDNMRIKLIHPHVVTDRIAQWYNTAYSVQPIAEAQLKEWTAPPSIHELQLPTANPYIVDNTSVFPIEEKNPLPTRLIHSDAFECWFAQDDNFQLPKGDFFLSFDCPYALGGVGNNTLKKLWVAVVQEQLNETFYQADIAGLNFHLYPHQCGFTLHTSGFSEKQLLFAGELINTLFQCKIDSQRFEQVKQRQLHSVENTLLNKPINRLFNKMSILIQRNAYSPTDMTPIIQNATLEQVNLVGEQLLSQYHCTAFLHGNWATKIAADFATTLQQKLTKNATTCSEIKRHIVDLRHQQAYHLEIESNHDDAAVVFYFQAPSHSVSDIAMTILAEQLWEGAFFNEIRMHKKLGYMVGSGYVPFNTHPGMAFYVQSPTADVTQLIDAIHHFLQKSVNELPNLPSSHWQKVKLAVQKQLIEHDQNLAMKSQRLWMAIANKDEFFNHQSRLVQCINELSIATLFTFCQDLITRNHFGELILYSKGKHTSPDALPINGEKIDAIDRFKKQAHYLY
ncbi:insulinase family protein [Alteromonadaceae bacterium BrNp21-10]|nr:insulinase family protein [Alteromonadaceae bacterium BrNp21-10]